MSRKIDAWLDANNANKNKFLDACVVVEWLRFQCILGLANLY
jgi:hypothetical protein